MSWDVMMCSLMIWLIRWYLDVIMNGMIFIQMARCDPRSRGCRSCNMIHFFPSRFISVNYKSNNFIDFYSLKFHNILIRFKRVRTVWLLQLEGKIILRYISHRCWRFSHVIIVFQILISTKTLLNFFLLYGNLLFFFCYIILSILIYHF